MKSKTICIILLLSLLFGTFMLTGCQETDPTPEPFPTAELAVSEESEPEDTVEVEETEPEPESMSLILATTTSTENSGLLAAILPDFEAKQDVTVDVVAVGTGQALQLGMDGNADVLLVHARAREDAFMADGHGSRREDVMYNDFVILGPADDPAGIRGKNRASKALQLIADAGATFVSRGDDSGTHTKEKALWAEAGVQPAGDWYVSAGQGMGAVLTMTDEQQAYTLSDRATYLARTLEGIDLSIMVEGEPILFNPYGVMAVNPDKGDHIKVDLVNAFIDWLISVETQQLISDFGVAEFGNPLFTPDSGPWREAAGGEAATEEEVVGDVTLTITGLVDNEMAWTEDRVKAEDGVIGALSATGLAACGEDGRYVLVGRSRELEGLQPISVLLGAGISAVCMLDGGLVNSGLVHSSKLRPARRGGLPVAVVEPCIDGHWMPLKLD